MADGTDAPGGDNNNDGGDHAPDWRDSLPENARGWDEAKNADSPEAFWSQIENHRSMVGRSVQIPTGDASEEDRSKFFERMKQHFPDITQAPDYDNPEVLTEVRRRMGMPEEASGYVAPEFEVPEGVELNLNDQELSFYRDMAHKEGLTQSQFNALMDATLGQSIQQTVEHQDLFNREMDTLKKEWGAAFDQKSAEAEKIREEFFPHVPKEMNAASIASMAAIAAQFGVEGHSLTETADKVRSSAMTPAEARQRAHEIMNDRNGPYWNTADPMHKQTREKYSKLLQIANS